MAISRLASNAARFASYSARAQAAQAIRDARSTASLSFEAAREAARVSSYIAPSSVLSAIDAGGGHATIQIANHKRVYPVQGDVKVDDIDLAAVPDITGLANGTAYDVYYVDAAFFDPALRSTAPVCVATTSPNEAQVGFGPGIHYLGKVTTPAAGGGATSGGDLTPPGGRGQLPSY